MKDTAKALQIQNNFWFSYFGQGYYYSVGYFAYGKTEYGRSFARNLHDDHLGKQYLS